MGLRQMAKGVMRRPSATTTRAGMTIGGAAVIPHGTRPTFVNAVVTITCTDAQNRTVNLQVEDAPGSGNYVTEAVMRNNPDVSGLGVGVTDIEAATLSAWIPAGHGYRFTQSGTGTAALTQIRESTL